MANYTAFSQIRRSFVLLIAVGFAAAIGSADSMSTQVSCGTGGQAATIGATSCSVSGTGGYANDNLNLSVNGPAASPYTSVQLSENGYAQGTIPLSSYPGSAGVTSFASLDMTLDTAGVERAGYVQVSLSSNLDTEFALADLTFSIGALDGGCYPHTSQCTIFNTPPVASLLPSTVYNFTLGEPFSVQLNYTDQFAAQQDSSYSPVSGDFGLQFRFFESDGVTPVALSPEPGTFGLLLAPLLCLLLVATRHRSKSS